MIPIIDISGSPATFSSDVAQACSDVGFVAVTGHGISESTIAAMRSMVEQVFAQTNEVKAANRIQPANYRGYIPLGFFTPNRPADGEAPEADAYEGFKLHWECPPSHPALDACDLYGQNRWLDELPAMRTVVLDYWTACDVVADKLLRGFALELGLDEQSFLDQFEAPITNMTLLHYPPQDPRSESPSFHPHKDTNAVTLLYPDPIGGLRLQQRDGNWVEAVCPPEALLVNVGDMMELWSGGRFISTPHQVVNRTGAERYSFPYFSVPTHSAVVQPLVDPLAGFDRVEPIPVGHWSAEVWRTNWPDQKPADDLPLGTLD